MEHIKILMVVTIACGVSAGERAAKSLNYYNQGYLDQPPMLLDSIPQEYTDYDDQLGVPDFPGQEGNEILSRSRPSRPKPDSPVYYIRLPPAPYVLVPGVGYVSRPPTLRPPPVVQPRPNNFINLPVKFVSNGKPTGVYSFPQDSQINQLDKGPYVFNGRPSDIFFLRNTYNSLYEDALQNFYP